jgi:SAM-dependent methyltransferase
MKGVVPSPNIWRFPQLYEVENRGVDPDGVIESAIRELLDWTGTTVLDVGCGTGFHLPRFAADAAQVIGVEPHPPLVELAGRRIAGLPDPEQRARIEIRSGTAQELPIESNSIDLLHARWAYFFGPGCEPGLAEVRRVLRPGGVAVVIDNDATRSTFGGWFRRGLPSYDPFEVERFWARQGWIRRSLDIRWELPTRADFEAVVGIEFPPDLAREILASHPGRTVDYAVNLLSFTGGTRRRLWAGLITR